MCIARCQTRSVRTEYVHCALANRERAHRVCAAAGLTCCHPSSAVFPGRNGLTRAACLVGCCMARHSPGHLSPYTPPKCWCSRSSACRRRAAGECVARARLAAGAGECVAGECVAGECVLSPGSRPNSVPALSLPTSRLPRRQPQNRETRHSVQGEKQGDSLKQPVGGVGAASTARPARPPGPTLRHSRRGLCLLCNHHSHAAMRHVLVVGHHAGRHPLEL